MSLMNNSNDDSATSSTVQHWGALHSIMSIIRRTGSKDSIFKSRHRVAPSNGKPQVLLNKQLSDTSSTETEDDYDNGSSSFDVPVFDVKLAPSDEAVADLDKDIACDEAIVENEATKRVTFTTVHIRTYKMMVGDNPYCECPLSLSWDRVTDQDETITIDAHQNMIASRRTGYSDATVGPTTDVTTTTPKCIEPLTVAERKALLRLSGLSKAKITQAERRRCVMLALEWAYRPNREEQCVCSCPHAESYIRRYVV